MRDVVARAGTTAAVDQDAGAAIAGRSTLSEPAAEPEPPLPTHLARAAPGAGGAPGQAGAPPKPVPHYAPPDAVQVTPDDPAAQETVYSDNRKHPHGAPFERKHAHAEKHRAKQDKYNKARITNDPTTAHSVGRPGAQYHGKSLFMLDAPEATRYTYVHRDGKNVAQPFDIVKKADLSPVNYNASHLTKHQKAQAKGKDQRLLLNPAMPRSLEIDGHEHPCVLSWVDGMGAAWLPVHKIAGGGKGLIAAVKARAGREGPGTLSHDPAKLKAHTTRYLVRNDKVGERTPGDAPGKPGHEKEKVLAAGAKQGDNVVHYLTKDMRKPGFGAHDKPLGKNVTRSFVALCMNLPEGKTPPVAIDTALAGESFFVMNDASFHRSVAVYGNGKHTSSVLQTWVFGHLAMRDKDGHLVPDPARRGWVPLRTLAVAAGHDEQYIEPRKPKPKKP